MYSFDENNQTVEFPHLLIVSLLSPSPTVTAEILGESLTSKFSYDIRQPRKGKGETDFFQVFVNIFTRV